MITEPIRVKYVDGVLQPLGSIGLSEGEEVMVRLEALDEMSPKVKNSERQTSSLFERLAAIKGRGGRDASASIDNVLYEQEAVH